MEEKYYIIIENIKYPIICELTKLTHAEGYVTMSKQELRSKIPEKLYKKLIKNGLYTNEQKGLAHNDRRYAFHRLICCLYCNIKKFVIHHIKQNQRNTNNITNIVPVSRDIHDELDHNSNGYQISLKLQKEFKDKVYKKKKETLANNDNLIMDILAEKENGLSPQKIIRKFKNKIKSTSIYNHLKTFFYAELFLNWIENKSNIEKTELDEKFNQRWSKIIEFESL